MTIRRTCKKCQNESKLEVSAIRYDAYIRKNLTVHEAFPTMSSDNQSIMVTGLCNQCLDDVMAISH